METERKKFHPVVIPVYFIKGLRSFLFLFFLLLVDLDGQNIYTLLGLSALVLLLLAKGIVKYLTQTYQISAEKIIVYRGVFKKRETEITYDRIQTIKQRQWFFFKPFNVTEVLIETAGSSPGEAEASLTAVDLSLVDLIEGYRNKTAVTETETGPSPKQPGSTFTLPNSDIGLYALTDVTAILVFGTLVTFVFEWLPNSLYSEVGSLIDYFQGILLLLLAFTLITAIAALSLLKNFVLFYDFQASRTGDTLTIEYGLFERKTQKIPLNKIQGIRLNRQLIRSLFQRSSVELIIMGGQEKEEGGLNMRNVYLFPLVKDRDVYKRLDQFLPDITIQKPAISKVSEEKLWYFWRWSLLFGVPLVIFAFYLNSWVGTGFLTLLLIKLGLDWKNSRVQGYAVLTNGMLSLQNFQGLSTVQLFIAQKNIQALAQSTTLWLAKKQLGHLKVSYKDGELPAEFSLRFISQADSKEIHEKFWDTTLSPDFPTPAEKTDH